MKTRITLKGQDYYYDSEDKRTRTLIRDIEDKVRNYYEISKQSENRVKSFVFRIFSFKEQLQGRDNIHDALIDHLYIEYSKELKKLDASDLKAK